MYTTDYLTLILEVNREYIYFELHHLIFSEVPFTEFQVQHKTKFRR